MTRIAHALLTALALAALLLAPACARWSGWGDAASPVDVVSGGTTLATPPVDVVSGDTMLATPVPSTALSATPSCTPAVTPSPTATPVTLAQVVDGPLPPGLKVLCAEGLEGEGKSAIWMANVDDLSWVQIIATFPYRGAGRVPGGYISPDAQKLAYIIPGRGLTDGTLGIVSIDGSENLTLAAPVRGSGTGWDVRWSPDGRWLAYKGPTEDPGRTEIRLVRPDGSETRRLASAGATGLLGWAGENRLCYVDDLVPKCIDTHTLSVISAPVVGRVYRAELAPGGEKLACLSAGGGGALAMTSLDGRERRVLLESVDPRDFDFENYQLWPVWSPDGRSLAYNRIADRKHTELVVVHLDSGATEIVLQEAAEVYHRPMSWSPDGRWIALNIVHPLGRGGRLRQALAGLDGSVRWVYPIRQDSLPMRFVGWLPE